MLLRTLTIAIAAVLSLAAAQAAAQASAYPGRSVRIIVPYGAGGASDILPRTIGAKLTEMWGHSVVVDNRVGGLGAIGIGAAVKSDPDGYTLLSAPFSNLVINPHLYPNLPFDVAKDLVPITLMGTVQNVLVVNPSTGINSVRELVASARANPGKLAYASVGQGSISHLAAELLQSQSGTKMLHIPYKGIGASMTELLAGQTSMSFAQMPSALPNIKAGKLTALAVAGAARSALLPDLPTLAEAGFPIDASSWYALMAPTGTPTDIIAKIQSDVSRVLQIPDIRTRLEGMGVEGGGNSTAELAAQIRADFARFGEIVRRANIKLE